MACCMSNHRGLHVRVRSHLNMLMDSSDCVFSFLHVAKRLSRGPHLSCILWMDLNYYY